MAEPYVRFTPNYDWRNKHQNVRRRAARLYSVWNLWEPGSDPTNQDWRAGLAGLRKVIGEAESLGRRIRPLGGSWSLSDVAASSDFMVDTKALNMMTVGMRQEHLAPEAQGRAETLVFAQCGVSILELNRKLEGRGLSLKTSGASTGQTLAGALATGTHGSARDVGSIQEFVVGLHLCGEGGENVWIERGGTPIASDAFIAFLGATRVLRDDHLFRAALVGVGAFGGGARGRPRGRAHLPLGADDPPVRRAGGAERHSHPGRGGAPAARRRCPAVSLRDGHQPLRDRGRPAAPTCASCYKRAFADLPAAPVPGPVVTAPGDDLLGVIGEIGDIALRGAGMSLELGVPLAQAEAALNVIVAVAHDRPFGGLIALRYVRATDARLGFTRFAPVTCTIELPSTLSGRTHDAFESIVENLDAASIPFALHWGQCLPVAYSAGRVDAVYGADADAYREARRTLLPTPRGRRMFASEALERVGLAG